MYAQKSFICYESYNKCKLLFLYFLLFSSKFCTNMYACFNKTSRKVGGNMSSSFYIYNEKSEIKMQYFETRSDNQGQKSLDRLSLFSFIHPFTVLTLIFCLFLSGIVTPQSLYPNAIPPSHPLFQCCAQ